ncbi:MAG: ChuX/HutX family heme-like substrate-binding protein, partial [Pseudomonadota bacterium]
MSSSAATRAARVPADIRALRGEHADLRERDFADRFDISEAELVAAYCGQGAVHRIESHPDSVIPAVQGLGEVMALTRNPACVHEKVGVYERYEPGQHAAMVLGPDIDLRIFPSRWRHAYLVEKPFREGVRRSVQIFDAAGDAVHKVWFREGTDPDGWARLCDTLPVDDQTAGIIVVDREPVEGPRIREDKAETLREEWRRLTDTHQFLR